MIAVNHALTGALIAVGIKQPWLAIPAAFASHFVLDALPHFWIQVRDGNVRARNARLLFKVITRCDVALSAVGLIVLPWTLHTVTPWWLVLCCAVAAMLPDSYWVYLFIKDGKSEQQTRKTGFAKFHKNIQWLEREWALPIDIIFFAVGVVLVDLVR